MIPSAANATFADRVARLHAEMARDGVPFSDMRRSPSLETQLAGVPDVGARPPARASGIEPLEGSIEARPVPRLAPGTSRLRYFLDGAQRTLPCWRVGLAPVVATITAAAVLRRDAAGRCEVVPGTLRLEHAWLVPRRLAEPRLEPVIERIEAAGGLIVDPLAPTSPDDDDGEPIVADYGHLVERAYAAARQVREAVERDLLRDWAADPAIAGDEGWIVVDGRLRLVVPRAVGLVKQFGNAYLAGGDAETLLGLAPGHRTTAFHPTDRFRQLGLGRDDEPGPDPDARTLWYQRLWDSAGRDARHALIRVEAGPDVRTTAEIDQLAAWVMAERTPRATADARWATLLYPVHFLERILKRRLEADTRGWPGA